VIPGSNLLKKAARVIRFQGVNYYKYGQRSQNPNRVWVTVFAQPVIIAMSVQRVPRNKYIELGLDLQRNYIDLFASLDLVDIQRDATGDQVVWGGRLYQIESQGTWFDQDGWAKATAVDVGSVTTAPYPPLVTQ